MVCTLSLQVLFFAASLVNEAVCSYFASGSNLHVFWSQDPLLSKNESYFVRFENLDMRDHDCNVLTTKNIGKVRSFDRTTGSHLSTLIPVNVTLSGVDLTEVENGPILTDYRFVKFEYNLAYETSVYLSRETNRAKIDYCLVSLDFPNITCETLSSTLSIETTIKFYHEKLTNMQYEVCLEILNGVWTVTFKVGLFNTSNSQVFRKKILFALDDPKTYYQVLKDVQMLPLGSFDWGQNKQFLVFQKNTELLYLISSIGGLQKNSNIIAVPIKMGFKINMVYFVNGQFIIFDTKDAVRDVNGTLVDTFMNYFVLHDLGKELEVKTITQFRNLSRGRYLDSFTTKDRAIIMLDFQMPDLDGHLDETLISSLYYSRTENIFATYVEEYTVNAPGILFLDGSYRRYHTQNHLIEIHKQVVNNKASDYYSICVINRETGKALGDVIIPIKQEIKTINFLEDEKMLMIKFAKSPATQGNPPNTLFVAIQDPYFIYKMQVDNLSKPEVPGQPKRRLQVLKDDEDTVLTVTCRRHFESSTELFTRAAFNITLINEFNDYFFALIRNPKNDSSNVSAVHKNLTTIFNISGLFPSGIELNLDTTKFIRGSFIDISVTNEQRNTAVNFQLRKEYFWVDLETFNLSMPIYFENKKGKTTQRSLIMDYHSNTSYYSLKGNKFAFVKKGIDSRSISSVEMLNEATAMINISKNIFSFDIEHLAEQPLTGIGSFCIGAKNVRFNDINQFILCMANASVSAQYSHEKFAASQTKIRIFQQDMFEHIKKYSILGMLYSKEFPSVVFVLSLPIQRTITKTYSLHAFEFLANTDIMMQKAASFDLIELSTRLIKDKDQLVSYVVIKDHLIFVTQKNRIYLYLVHLGFVSGTKYRITYLRSFDLMDHFPSHEFDGKNSSFSIKILRQEHIVMYDTANSKAERVQVERLCFLIEMEVDQAGSKRVFYNVVIFDHLLSSYEAFDTLFKTTECAKLFMGPAFLNEGESQERTLSVICLDSKTLEQASTTGSQVRAQLNILQSFKNMITFSDDSSIDDILNLESKQQTESAIKQRSYTLQMTKSSMLPDVSRFASDDSKIAMVSPKMPVRVKFAETYESFSTRSYIDPKFKTLTAIQTGADMWFLRKKQVSAFTVPLKEYFEGHIFNTHIECESFIECRDKIINGTGQLLFEGDIGFMPEYLGSSIHRFGHSSITNGPNFTYLITEAAAIFNMSDTGIQVISLGSLLTHCSEQAPFERFLVAFCTHKGTRNFFRIFDFEKSMSYFDINITFPTSRILNPKDVTVSIKEDYLVLYTFNSFISRYLTAYLFKLTMTVHYESRGRTFFFHNPLFNKLGILYFGENPMNDESVSFKVYRANDKVLQRPVLQELESSVDRLYIWSLRRKSASSFDIRIQGYLLEPKLNEESRKRWFNVMPVCDDKRMELSFDLWNQSSSSYLLDQARLILMNVEDKQYYDMIIHLPFAHDYLLRVSSEKLENKDKKTLSIFNDARILVISNPFFGIRSSMQVRPIFVNSTYYVPSNYFPERSMIRCYYIDQKVKERANKPPENFLFNYRVKSEEKKRSVIQEHELNTIYTFGLLRFQGLIQAVFYNDPILMAGEYFTNTLNYGSPS